MTPDDVAAAELGLSICLGIGLAAACGFRVFLPLLALSLGAHAGHLEPGAGFAWVGSTPALLAFGVATVLEIGAYYVPWLDNLLDTVCTPAALIAGVLVTAAVVGDMSPLATWTLSVIAGGGSAGVVQAGTVIARGGSALTTGGVGNPLLSTLEAGGAGALSVVALFVPLLAGGLVLLGALVALAWLWRRRRRRRRPAG